MVLIEVNVSMVETFVTQADAEKAELTTEEPVEPPEAGTYFYTVMLQMISNV